MEKSSTTKGSKPTKQPKKSSDYTYVKRSFVVGKNEDGSQKRITVRGRNKKEADAKLAEAKRLYSLGHQDGDGMTVYEWAERWLQSYKTNVSETQRKHYAAKLKNDILPVLGYRRIKDVTSSDLQLLLNTYKGKKKGTVEKVKHSICLLFADATYEGIIDRDPSLRLEMPEVVEVVRRPIKLVERKALIKVTKSHIRGPFVLTILYTGMRRGECLALTRGDVDLENKRINITKAIRLNGNRPKLVGTKSAEMKRARTKVKRGEEEYGCRVVPIPDLLLPVIASVCANKEPNDILFPIKDGVYATDSACRRWWNSILRQCHLATGAKTYRNKLLLDTSQFDDDVTPHYLRHTYATDMLSAGVDSYTRSELLGHSSKDTTGGYTKLTDAAFYRALEQLNDYLNVLDAGDK